MAESKHAVLVMAVAVTFVAFGGLLVTFSNPSLTGAAAGVPSVEHSDTLVEHQRLVFIHPRVGAAHRFIMDNPAIKIKEEQGTDYIALVDVNIIPQLKTMADVKFLSE